MNSWQSVLVTVAIGLAVTLAIQGVRILIAYRNTKNYFWGPVDGAVDAGYDEKSHVLRDGLTVNYAEGPRDGIPLLLIHGQGMRWQEYARALPALAETYHVIAVDCHGHGKTTWNPDDYTADRMADDLALFIDRVFGAPCIVSGHSSGGLIATRMAARHPEKVRGVVIEDAPFFSTEPDRMPATFSWIDTFRHIPEFLTQTDERDWVCYFMPRSYWSRLFGPLWPSFTRHVIRQRRADPDRLPLIRWVGVGINRIWEAASHPYDIRFSASFQDFSWFDGFDQAETLRQVRCPTTFIKASTRRDTQGNLLAALDDEDCARVDSLLPDNRVVRVRSSHDVHFAKTTMFVRVMKEFATRVA
ncbi:MAG TPA: alpha/beta hydrolase [Agromyces sp.]|nr:alpha/beta hydrolase [Agromyces sp.]